MLALVSIWQFEVLFSRKDRGDMLISIAQFEPGPRNFVLFTPVHDTQLRLSHPHVSWATWTKLLIVVIFCYLIMEHEYLILNTAPGSSAEMEVTYIARQARPSELYHVEAPFRLK